MTDRPDRKGRLRICDLASECSRLGALRASAQEGFDGRPAAHPGQCRDPMALGSRTAFETEKIKRRKEIMT
jgi:hypothetical protein